MGRPDGARGRRPPLSKAFACNFAQAYEAAARPQSVVDMRVARSLTSLSSAERLCHYPEGWSKTTAVENDSRRKRQPRSLTAFRVSGVSSPGAHPMKTLAAQAPTLPARSEEHTSELQSLMRRSYAVFCLK